MGADHDDRAETLSAMNDGIKPGRRRALGTRARGDDLHCSPNPEYGTAAGLPLVGAVQSPGCLGSRLYTDNGDPSASTLIEEWESQRALDRHLTSAAYKTLVAAIVLSA
jgi:Antibiotic biosynthesis monooxygenase